MRIDHVGVLALVVGLFGGNVEAGQEGTDMKLEDMGFIMRPANTPEQMERLRLLPARKFVARAKGGSRYYLYADPDYCQCVFVGNELAMKNYRALNAPSSAPPDANRIERWDRRGGVHSGNGSVDQRDEREWRYS